MSPRQRSLAGLVLAVLMVPVLAGLLACLPVPIGNPERSRIDNSLNGLWLWEEGVALFEPYDKRTWLVSLYYFDTRNCDSGYEVDVEEQDYATVIAELRGKGFECLRARSTETYKGWLADIGRADFMTWEPKGEFDDEYGFEPELWFGWRLDRENADAFRLQMVDAEFEGFATPEFEAQVEKYGVDRPRDPKSVNALRREFERVIRRNLDDDGLYADQLRFLRIQPNDYDIFIGRVLPEIDPGFL